MNADFCIHGAGAKISLSFCYSIKNRAFHGQIAGFGNPLMDVQVPLDTIKIKAVL